MAPAIGLVGLVVAGIDAGSPAWLSVARTLVGALFLGAITDAMLLGHWYLVQPGLARGPLLELVRATALVWPAEVAPGIVPAGLAPYLAGGFTFSKPEYTLDWENFVPPGGGPSGGMQLGVVLTSSNARFTNSLAKHLGSKAPFFMVGNALTYVIVGPDGRI